jgi:small subunit ribosomal protein S11
MNSTKDKEKSLKQEDSLKDEAGEKKPAAKMKGKKIKIRLSKGRAYIQSTYNNTIITITDLNGRVIVWGSAGILGFRGAKRSTPFAATEIAKYVVDKLKDTGLSEIDVFVKGVGGGRESAIRSLNTYGLKVVSIKDVTPIPHNGCRPPKVRRV